MSDDMFDNPGSGDQIDLEAVSGRLVLVKPLQHLTDIKTAFGAKDAIEADVHVLDGDQAGTVYRAVYLFPLVLIGQLKGNVRSGRFNLGRFGKGEPKPGQNAPWKLLDPSEDDRGLARRYIASDKYKANSTATPVAAAPAATDPWGTTSEAPPF